MLVSSSLRLRNLRTSKTVAQGAGPQGGPRARQASVPESDSAPPNPGRLLREVREATPVARVPGISNRFAQERTVGQLQIRDQADVGAVPRLLAQLEKRERQRLDEGTSRKRLFGFHPVERIAVQPREEFLSGIISKRASSPRDSRASPRSARPVDALHAPAHAMLDALRQQVAPGCAAALGFGLARPLDVAASSISAAISRAATAALLPASNWPETDAPS